jgi:hypothetical protein
MHATPASPPPKSQAETRRSKPLRFWVVLAIIAVIVSLALYHAIEPYDERGIVAIPHGDHNHYVPRDRDPEVSISNFPTIPPGPNERITPDGRVVPITP